MESSTPPKLLLLTGTIPGASDGAGIILRDLCLAYPRGRLVCSAFIAPEDPIITPLEWLPTQTFPMPRLRLFTRVPRPLRDGLKEGYDRLQQVRVSTAFIAQATAQGRAHAVDGVWAVLNHPLLIYSAHRIAAALGKPLYVQVWDDPAQYLAEKMITQRAWKPLMQAFAHSLQTAAQVMVVSEPMEAEYRRRYSLERTVVLCHGLPETLQQHPPPRLSTDDSFSIGFAGTFYGTTAWNALLRALDACGWRVGGREVCIHVLGVRLPDERTFSPRNIRFLGYRPWEDVTRLLSQTDVLYVPSWFSPAKQAFTQWSFPSRLPSYLAAGRPILYHGEAEGSVMRFLRRYPCGLACHTLDADDLLRTLTQFTDDAAAYAAMCLVAQQAARQEFSEGVLRARFAAFLGINPMELHPSTAVSTPQTANRQD